MLTTDAANQWTGHLKKAAIQKRRLANPINKLFGATLGHQVLNAMLGRLGEG